MDRKTLKILLVHEEFKDIVQAYIDQSESFDGELLDVFYGQDYRGSIMANYTSLQLQGSKKLGGDARVELSEGNTLIIDAINLWVSTRNLPFSIIDFERVSVKEKGEDNPYNRFWLVEVRTK